MWFNRAETKTMIKKEIKMTVVARVFKFMCQCLGLFFPTGINENPMPLLHGESSSCPSFSNWTDKNQVPSCNFLTVRLASITFIQQLPHPELLLQTPKVIFLRNFLQGIIPNVVKPRSSRSSRKAEQSSIQWHLSQWQCQCQTLSLLALIAHGCVQHREQLHLGGVCTP